MLLKTADLPKVRLCKILTADKIQRKSTPLDSFPKTHQEVSNGSSPELSRNLLETMWKMVRACLRDDGIGLAAPQIGVFKQMFIIREDADHFRVYLHPRYSVDASSKQEIQVEGCLSVFGKRVPVSRATVILAEWLEFNSEGKLVARTELLEGLKARVFQHEHDHFSCLSILDRYEQQRKARTTPSGHPK